MYQVACVIAGLLLLVPLWLLGQPSSHVAAADLTALRDRFRPLLLFHGQVRPKGDGAIRDQLALLEAHRVDLQARDVVVIPIPAEDGYDGFPQNEEQALRRRFRIEPGEFAVVLVGKDGGEKFRTHAPVTIEKLDTLIDAMPMRQEEIRNGHAK